MTGAVAEEHLPPDAGSAALLRTAYSLIANVLLVSALGFAFWIVAARLLPASDVGRDSALISAMIAISSICQLNLAGAIYRFLRVTRVSPARVILTAYGVTALIATAAAIAFVLAAPAVSDDYSFLRERSWPAITFVAAVALWGVFNLQDAALTALGRAPWVPVENAVFGILKISLLPVLLAVSTGHAIFVSWVVPMVLLLLPMNVLLFRRAVPERPPRGEAASPVEQFGRRGLFRFLAQDYLGAVSTHASATMLPVVVVALLGSSQGAHFYVPFMIILTFDQAFANVAASVTVEGAVAGERFPLLVRTAVRRFGLMLAAGMAAVIVLAPLVLLPFGEQYADAGAPVLRLLALASVMRAVVVLYIAICRVEGRSDRALGIQAFTLVVVLVATLLLGPDGGIVGIGIAWLLAHTAAAFVAAPHLVSTLRRAQRLRKDPSVAGASAAPDVKR